MQNKIQFELVRFNDHRFHVRGDGCIALASVAKIREEWGDQTMVTYRRTGFEDALAYKPNAAGLESYIIRGWFREKAVAEWNSRFMQSG